MPDDFVLDTDISDAKIHKEYLEKIVKAMENAGIPDYALSFDELANNNYELANILIKAFIKKEYVTLNHTAKSDVSFGTLKIGNINLIILAKRLKEIISKLKISLQQSYQ